MVCRPGISGLRSDFRAEDEDEDETSFSLEPFCFIGVALVVEEGTDDFDLGNDDFLDLLALAMVSVPSVEDEIDTERSFPFPRVDDREHDELVRDGGLRTSLLELFLFSFFSDSAESFLFSSFSCAVEESLSGDS